MNLAATLGIAGLTLLVAIYVGNQMGNRVLGQATERGPAIAATPISSPSDLSTSGPGELNWKHEQVISVATDPGFPDPRVTPEPPPPPPKPTAQPSTPKPRPTPAPTPTSSVPYTSPPLPIPLATHSPEANSTDASASPEPSATEGAAP